MRNTGPLSKIRALARKLAREEETQQASRRSARALARKGRDGDTEIAHVTPGEIVLPKEMQTPEVMAALDWAAAGIGLTLDRLRVGAHGNSINPETGAPEFFLDGLRNWFASKFGNQSTTPRIDEINIQGTPRTEKLVRYDGPTVLDEITVRGNRTGLAPQEGDVDLLARMMLGEAAEAHKTPGLFEGLGWAAYNRIREPGFPNNLRDVIYQKLPRKPGYQFDSVEKDLWNKATNGTLEPGNAIAFKQAQDVSRRLLNGEIRDPTGGATYFYTGKPEKPPQGFFTGRMATGELVPMKYIAPFTFLGPPKK